MYNSINFQTYPNKPSSLTHKTPQNHSLQADIITGWIPKMKIVGPVPLKFDCFVTDQIIEELSQRKQQNDYQIIYLGRRPRNSYQLHQRMNYNFKYEHIYKNSYSHLQPFFKRFQKDFQIRAHRPFIGMNPNIQKSKLQVQFNSDFQCGNLDAVIKINQAEYDLFLRIDSNTQGHLQWYYFKLKNITLNTIKLNIVNFKRSKTLYTRGMKPFIKINGKWKQAGNNILFRQQILRYEFLQQYFQHEQYTFKQLSFQYKFEKLGQQIQIAYCIPYTYTRLTNLCNQLISNHLSKNVTQYRSLCDSLSGLEIPLLIFTNPNQQNKHKKCIFIIGRQHPGESNSSYVMEGFIKWIVSDEPQAKQLLNNTIIKIVPMLNPDGVVVGNFRTSFCGKDLNRLFKSRNTFMYPQVQFLKKQVSSTKQQFQNRFSLFLDFHGHSTRKNVFAFGPGFNMGSSNYYRARIFPKIIADNTNMFRFYSCTFNISQRKQSTARALFNRYVPFSYTIQSSNWAYYDYLGRIQWEFNDQKWETVGHKLALSTHLYIENLNLQDKQFKIHIQRIIQKKQEKPKKQQKTNRTQIRNHKKFGFRYSYTSKGTKMSMKQYLNRNQMLQNPIILQIKKIQERNMILEEKVQSDEYDSQQDDSQSSNEDFTQQHQYNFSNKVHKMMLRFQNCFQKKQIDNQIKPNIKIKKIKKKQQVKKKQKVIKIQAIACLKKNFKMIQINKIAHEQRNHNLKCSTAYDDIIYPEKKFQTFQKTFAQYPGISQSQKHKIFNSTQKCFKQKNLQKMAMLKIMTPKRVQYLRTSLNQVHFIVDNKTKDTKIKQKKSIKTQAF